MNNIAMQYGKKIENNIVASLRKAGFTLNTSGELDHNNKIDFVIRIKNQIVGVQCSLKKDMVKARVAKICALDVVPRFIYLHIANGHFTSPERHYGRDLYKVLSWSIEKHSNNEAFMLSIGKSGLQVSSL